MHEYALAQRIIRLAEQCAYENNARRVTAIHLVVGEYSGCIAESIAANFDLLSSGSICADADLDIERVKPMLKCKNCNRLFERKPYSFCCPDKLCGGEGEPTEIGHEFYIRSVELEQK